MSKQFDIAGLEFSVYQTKRGGYGIRLVAPPSKLGAKPFVICSYLDANSGEALFGLHPVLGSKWRSARTQLERCLAQQGGFNAHQVEAPAPVQTPAQTEVKRGPGRPRRVKASEVEAPKAETTAPAQGMDPATRAALEAMNAKIAAIAELLVRKSA
jgi:hypothetical protein